MNKINRKDKDLLDAIQQGDSKGWSQLIEQYQGRLLNFAKSRLPQHADAEDIVQNTFVSFIKNLNNFRYESSLEAYLFVILRNNIYNTYRTRYTKSVCLLQDIYNNINNDDSGELSVDNATPSQYLWKNEQKQILVNAIRRLIKDFKKSKKFRDLKIMDLLFYSGISNKDVAKLLGLKYTTVSMFKHRCIKKIQEDIKKTCLATEFSVNGLEGMLTEIWDSQRLSCPKRNTIGAFLLEKLDAEWFDYIDFHITIIGCHFCRANLKDLINQNTSDQQQLFREQIMASTVGFLTRS